MPPSPASCRAGRLGVFIGVAILALGASPRAGHAQLAVVVNPGNTLADLSLDKLRRLFLGQAKTFPTGQHARLARHTPSAATFDRDALGLQPEIVRSRWMALIFRGEVTVVPTDLASADDVNQFVRSHPDAIAFMPAAQVDQSVKVLAIDGKRPGDSTYALR
jgi:ABC-type phosphate transport system substrate-binding protein